MAALALTRCSAVLAAGALALGPSVAPASAATTIAIGSNAVSSAVCNGAYLQVKSPDGSYRVPVDGVITSWTYRSTAVSAGDQIALRIGRPSGSTYVVAAGTDKVPVELGLHQVPSRLPVKAGDLLGWGATAYRGCGGASSGYEAVTAPVDPTSGPIYANNPPQKDFQLNISATVELDDDGDGFGDATQDQCPTSAATQGTCPVPPSAVPPATSANPDTTLASVTAAKATRTKAKAKVTAVFAGTGAVGFECAVDTPVFSRCTSPYVVKLRPGPHTLAVRAVSSAGVVDPTAAVRTVKVKVGKSRGGR